MLFPSFHNQLNLMCSNYGLLYPKSRRFLLLRGPILCVRDLEVIQVRVGKGILQLQLTPQSHTNISQSVITVRCFPINHGHPRTWTIETLSIHELNIIHCYDHPALEGKEMNHGVVLFVGQVNTLDHPQSSKLEGKCKSLCAPKAVSLKHVPSRVKSLFRSNTN